MIYESSYETGHKPFVPALKRGYWANANDFIYAGLSFGFRMDVFALTWMANVGSGVSGFFPTYLLAMAFYVVPLLIVKSFMGQFSSSGFISVFRVCPLFKGIGFLTLLMNISVLIYYSIFAMIPLVYLFASFNPTLPWSCDGAQKWTTENLLLCQVNGSDTCKQGCYGADVASNIYVHSLFKRFTIFGMHFSISWQMVLCSVAIWTIITVVVWKLTTEKIGLLVRYSVWFLIASLLIVLVRFSFLPGTYKHYSVIFSFNYNVLSSELMKLPIYGICAFGPGWGLLITLASFNRFNTNITRSSWLIGLGQMFVIFGLDMLGSFIDLFYYESSPRYYFRETNLFRKLLMSSGSAMATMAWSNLWCIIFYTLFSVAAIILMILQLHSILSSIFDEFVALRKKRQSFIIKLVSAMCIVSIYFASSRGLQSSTDLALDTILWQSLINLLLILVITWIYGRVRFQRDINFMTGSNFATWKIYILRFFVPLCMLAVMLFTIFISLFFAFMNASPTVFHIVLKTIPWWFIPAFSIYCLYHSQGSFKERFVKCCRPTDWFPVEINDRQRYEEVMNVSNMTHPLAELTLDDDYDDAAVVNV